MASDQPTRSYRPSNGTEGMLFDDAWCSRCQHDAPWREDNESSKPCEILNHTLIFDLDDPKYPAEWVEDDVPYPQPRNPRCTAFLPVGTEDSTYVKDERQSEFNV